MIPSLNIVAWSQTTPWTEQRQVEQDLIISRAMVALFSDDFLKSELRFRGGTALNKLHSQSHCATPKTSIWYARPPAPSARC